MEWKPDRKPPGVGRGRGRGGDIGGPKPAKGGIGRGSQDDAKGTSGRGRGGAPGKAGPKGTYIYIYVCILTPRLVSDVRLIYALKSILSHQTEVI